MATATQTIRIPSLQSWEKNTNGYQLFRTGLGYLRITRFNTLWEMTLQPDIDGVNVGPAEEVGTLHEKASDLVALAQQLYTTQHDKPVKKNIF